MDLEVQENNFECEECKIPATRYCHECLHFVNNGDRCDETNAVCYIGSYACSRFTEAREKYNYTEGKVML